MSIRRSHSILLDMYTDRPSARVGLSVYPLHWTVVKGLYGIVAGFFPPKNSRFILDHLGCFSVLQYRSVISRDRCQIHARCTRKTLILSYRRTVEGSGRNDARYISPSSRPNLTIIYTDCHDCISVRVALAESLPGLGPRPIPPTAILRTWLQEHCNKT